MFLHLADGIGDRSAFSDLTDLPAHVPRAVSIGLIAASVLALAVCLLGAVVLVCGTLTRTRPKQPVLDLSPVWALRGALVWAMAWWGALIGLRKDLRLPDFGNVPWYLAAFACSTAGLEYLTRVATARRSPTLGNLARAAMWGLPAVGGALVAWAKG